MKGEPSRPIIERAQGVRLYNICCSALHLIGMLKLTLYTGY